VVDEAGKLPTRQLVQLIIATAAAHGKLVLVGDDKQLPELAAGGAFRALAGHLHAATLTKLLTGGMLDLWKSSVACPGPAPPAVIAPPGTRIRVMS
jgi:AAA domain